MRAVRGIGVLGLWLLTSTAAWAEASPYFIEAPAEVYVGIGVILSVPIFGEDDQRLKNFGVHIKVLRTEKNGPADRAGVRAGDAIVRLEDNGRVIVPTGTATYVEAVGIVKGGDEGTVMRLVVLRRDRYGFLREKAFDIKRERIIP
ncbi:MAG: hypothetical protein A3I44_03805 [Candidatus Sungbacteria bacterium RIFCSPLOWO2_02_FULL_51_17]|uniref:PDZ domain-containing protein n=1 Tax=Candidatus Sungbacteria bacterium RIFCSPHIGHO2_02_FULL_51_29 TaxID=1802273 RepID=A0A1G2KQE2_9BACT|nr:MAG: hypothetical protein A2676_02325 [Candidatus Sungbacteria bacterium RIFCSPHIGHO2_01_FULL_51_22]OHA01484.1 MAG: hypothetical protein A3C16_05560 [Candidatus Sungbacteria bacterium RIFCSPHIGHO2_02_FULL_51_29]OHA06980.1 MAG: hypothetical protein A3B29_00265 [Candidatus Sungbacteria bacterium RIFCSPLOWO2_01_FULL_51_34]OHA11211.1 MAG: hypothetical protein A3I44_03805 [Candidatus Sungbacteria bacterium RIFCSPLOWO2_02_FULL_51_17]